MQATGVPSRRSRGKILPLAVGLNLGRDQAHFVDACRVRFVDDGGHILPSDVVLRFDERYPLG
jgi:hypothetical protein